MTLRDWLTTREITAIFVEEIAPAGGAVSDRFDDGTRLFLRAVLPGERAVRPGDRLRGGVALRATQEEISVHPYVFRQVCSNGAIRAHATQSLRIERCGFAPSAVEDVAERLRQAVRDCCADDAFAGGFAELRSATDSGIDLALTMIPGLSRLLGTGARSRIFTAVMDRFFAGPDQSRFGLMNAVTSVARDTRDPEVRWRLEAFGGGIPVAAQEANPQPDLVREEALLRAWREVRLRQNASRLGRTSPNEIGRTALAAVYKLFEPMSQVPTR
jgi:hypothetical protein